MMQATGAAAELGRDERQGFGTTNNAPLSFAKRREKKWEGETSSRVGRAGFLQPVEGTRSCFSVGDSKHSPPEVTVSEPDETQRFFQGYQRLRKPV